jgi:hypothetical protein
MRPRLSALFLAAALLLPAPPALANDSTASLDTGDLVLLPNDEVRMAEEELYLSPDRVRVRCVFENTGTRPVVTPVAFPLPPVRFDEGAGYAATPANPADVVGFRLWIDGVATPVSIDARAIGAGGQDVTGLLAKWGLPVTLLTPDADGADRLWRRIDALPPEALAELRAAGALAPDRGEGYVVPSWTAHVAYHWIMTFPPGRSVEVRHEYVPVPTHTFFTGADLDHRTRHDAACIDAGFEAAARRRMAAAPYGTLSAVILTYVLTTANNWRGPIGRFHLTVDKGSTAALVSLCRDGIRKTGPTTFEWEARDFVPDRELVLLFVRPMDGG